MTKIVDFFQSKSILINFLKLILSEKIIFINLTAY
jgi:hypothetical protein